jgi:hypothetical protein
MLISFFAFCGPLYAPADTLTPTEYQVKAAFLYNFTKFVEWPDKAFSNSTTPLNICILGRNPFENSIDIISDKSVQERITTVKMNPDSIQLNQCHILFISESENNRMAAILNRLDHSSVLTVADTEGFTSAGGMINLIMRDKKVCFEINLKAARKAGLKISSQLLSLAVRVQE